MKIIIDSDFISGLSNPDSVNYYQAISFINSLPEDTEICVSILTIYEVQFGRFLDTDTERKERVLKTLETMKSSFSIVNLSFDDSEIYGMLKSQFKTKTGMNQDTLKRHNIDIALASVAIVNNCVIVSRDKIYTDHLQFLNPKLQYKVW